MATSESDYSKWQGITLDTSKKIIPVAEMPSEPATPSWDHPDANPLEDIKAAMKMWREAPIRPNDKCPCGSGSRDMGGVDR